MASVELARLIGLIDAGFEGIKEHSGVTRDRIALFCIILYYLAASIWNKG